MGDNQVTKVALVMGISPYRNDLRELLPSPSLSSQGAVRRCCLKAQERGLQTLGLQQLQLGLPGCRTVRNKACCLHYSVGDIVKQHELSRYSKYIPLLHLIFLSSANARCFFSFPVFPLVTPVILDNLFTTCFSSFFLPSPFLFFYLLFEPN